LLKAEDGIRDRNVTGVQTCALPISSIINNGSIFKGTHHVTGQIGHVTIDPDGPLCSCGNYGCLETFTSETAILKMLKRKLKLGESNVFSMQNINIDDLNKIGRAHV